MLNGSPAAPLPFAELGVIDDAEPHAAALNMALDEVLLDGLENTALLRCYRWAGHASSFGCFGRSAAVRANYPESAGVRRWTGGAHDDDYRESWPAFRERVLGGLERLVRLSARNVIAFTSGGPITAVLQHATGLPDALAFSLNWPLVNTGITRLRFSARTGTLTLATYNSHPHLDATRDAATVTYR